MTHYHVWFTLKPGITESDGLAVARAFLRELEDRGDVARALLLRNAGEAPKSKLPRYHALIEFDDDRQMDRVFAAKRAEGIHTGAHGRLVDAVGEMHVEIFKEV